MAKNLNIDLDEDLETVVAENQSVAIVDEGGNSDTVVIDEDGGDEMDKLPKRAKVNDDGSVTLPLLEAVTITTKKDGKVRDRVYETLTFHRLKGADIQAIANAGKEKDTVVTFGRSTRIMQAMMNAIFDKLDAADIVDGGKIINHFLNSGRKTGR
jgi:hypothetical protein